MTEHGPSMTIEGVQTQIDRSLKHYATKEDTADVKIEVAKTETKTIKWIVGTGIALGGVVVATVGIAVTVLIWVLK